MAEGAALEKRYTLAGIVGSNPTLSATRGEVLEWSNRRAWKARRGRKPLVGSNPTLSAVSHRTKCLTHRRTAGQGKGLVMGHSGRRCYDFRLTLEF